MVDAGGDSRIGSSYAAGMKEQSASAFDDRASLDAFLTAVAAKTPAPGGGAVASAVGALGAALGSMVVAYSLGKKSLSAHDPLHRFAGERLERSRALLLGLSVEDERAYTALNTLQKLPEGDPTRVAQMPGAIMVAVDVPRSVVAASVDLLRLLDELCGTTNRSLASDLAIAAVLAEASARAGAWNVEINLSLIRDEARRATLAGEVRDMVDRARRMAADIEARCR